MQYLCIGYLFGAKPIQWPLMTLFTNADLCYDAIFFVQTSSDWDAGGVILLSIPQFIASWLQSWRDRQHNW